MHLLFMYGDAAAVKVDDQPACPENVGGAVCCIDTCQMADGGADAGEQFAKERAEEQLRQKQSVYEYRMSKASLARAVSRLKEKQRSHINL